jgi:hypothetical protein
LGLRLFIDGKIKRRIFTAGTYVHGELGDHSALPVYLGVVVFDFFSSVANGAFSKQREAQVFPYSSSMYNLIVV